MAVYFKNMASHQGLYNQQPVSVVVADDHPVVLYGITEILRAQPDISVVAACNGGRDDLEEPPRSIARGASE